MEQPIANATTAILKYDMASGGWTELGSQAGSCNITIYKSPANEYRFVGWKESNQEVVINSYLFPSMNYNESTPTFHQWFDESKNAYGLNFFDPNEAKKFGIAVISALEILNGSKTNKPAGDIVPPVKKSAEKSPGYRNTNRKVSVDRPSVSPYATTGVTQTNVSSAAKVPTVPTGKPQGGAPPPPGPPPSAPPPPGPPPSGPPPPGLPPTAPSVPSIKKPANDFASQLAAASQNMKSTSISNNTSQGSPTPPVQPTQSASSKPPQMDFLSELMQRSKNRAEGNNSMKKNEQVKISSAPSVSVNAKISTNTSSKLSASNSDLTTTSYVTSADLEKFRADLMQDIILNMDKFKDEIISSIISRLN